MLIDLKTLVLLSSVLGLLVSVMLTINWIMNRNIDGTGYWCLAMWSWALSICLLLLRGQLAPFMTVVISNGLVVVGSFFMLSGITRYHHHGGIPAWLQILLTLLMMAGIYYFSFVDVAPTKRILLLVLFSAMVKFTALYWLIPTIKKFTAVGIMIGVGFLVHGLFFAYHFVKGVTLNTAFTESQIYTTTVQLLMEVFLFMIWFTVSVTMLTNVVLQRGLRRMAFRDSLTGIMNRRSTLSQLSDLVENNNEFSVLMLDIDDFKKINDENGHWVGDLVLKDFAQTVSHELRDSDLFGRIGGEEFLIVLPETDIKQAEKIANRLCHVVSQQVIIHDNEEFTYTVSIGVNDTNQTQQRDAKMIIAGADDAMYQAKNEGKNRVVCMPSGSAN